MTHQAADREQQRRIDRCVDQALADRLELVLVGDIAARARARDRSSSRSPECGGRGTHAQLAPAFRPCTSPPFRRARRRAISAPSLARYVAYQNQLEAIRKRLVNASIYPALLLSGRRPGESVPAGLRRSALFRIYEERSIDLPVFSKILLAWDRCRGTARW